MMKREMDLFRLEDRVLFEAAAAVEIVEAAEAAHNDPNANVNEGEKQAQDDRDALKNAPPENPADQALHHDGGDPQDDPAHNADVNAQIDQIVNGDLPVLDDTPMPDGADAGFPDSDLTREQDDRFVEVDIRDTAAAVSTGRELVVINGTVPDKDAILADLKPNQEALILQEGNGLDELNSWLDGHADIKYDSIHFITHGKEGSFVVNGEQVDAEHFDAAEWAAVGEHLTDDGDILLYGCDLAKDAGGQTLCERIADASGADVAASTDTTGLHGNWELEYHVGTIEHASIQVDGYRHDLEVRSIMVNSLDDAAVDHSDDDVKLTLRDAFDTVNSAPGEYEIHFADGLKGTITLRNGVLALDSVTSGTTMLHISGDSDGDGQADITIDGAHSTRIMYFNAGNNVTLDHLNLQNGWEVNGGAIFNQGILAIDHVTFSQNFMSSCGGAIYNEGNMLVTDSAFEMNAAYELKDRSDGGAIYNRGTMAIDHVRFYRNTAKVSGGAVYNEGTMQVTSSVFEENEANILNVGNGGAIYNAGTLVLENISFDSNGAYRDGGAIYNAAKGELTVNNTTFSRNNAMGSGGAIFNENGQITVANSTFYNQRSADNGGAIYNDAGRLTVVGSTFYNNTAIGTRSEGGAIFSNGAASRLVLVNSILVGNVADVAAGNDLTTQNAALDIYYSFYGQRSGAIGKEVASRGNVKADDVFGDSPSPAEKEINGVKQIYFELKDGVEAVTMGTKVQVDGGGFLQYYYMDGPFRWETLGAVALTTAQLQHDQIGRSRLLHDSSEEYSIGAVSIIREDPSLTVDTVLDVVDPYDGVISLREALAYAAAGIKETDGTYTVTFANSLGSGIVITLDPALNALTVDSASFTKDAPLIIDGEGRVTLDGGHTVQLLNIASGNYVFLRNMTLRNGYDGGDGGAIINAGTLNIANVSFAGNSAGGDGGAIASTGTLNIANATFAGNSADNSGGAIANTGTLAMENVNFNQNTAVGNGGAIYSAARSSLTINTATFRENKANSGGAIYNDAALTVANSTFFGNEAVVNGGAIYSGNATLLIVGSTIYDNAAGDKGGGIYSPGIVIAVNSIFVGNSDSVKGDFYVSQADLYYSFYGGLSGKLSTGPGSRGNIKAADVFGDSSNPAGKEINGVTQNYFEFKDEAAIAMAGTKVQVDGGLLQYYNMTGPGKDEWQTIGAVALTTAQLQHDQIGRNRLLADAFLKYSPGAVQQLPSLTVTTDLDVTNPNDGLISLREALAYAAMGFTAADGSYTITFADSLGPHISITLNGTLGALSIDSPLFTQDAPLTIEGGGRVTLDGGKDTHILEIAADNHVFLNGMAFQNGHSDGNGGAIVNAGDLTVTGAAFTGNNTADGNRNGGAIYNTGTLEIANASFTGNTAGGSGGAIYSNGALTVVNSTFYGNRAEDVGGAIYFNGDTKFELTVIGSTLTGNSGRNGGGGILAFSGAMNLVNDIIVGNSSPTVGTDIESDGNITAIGLVYGNAVGSFVTEWHSYSSVQADWILTTEKPLTRVVDGITQSYFEIKNTSEVKVTSAGTKLQVDEDSGNLQYYDMGNSSWVNLGTTALTTDLVQHDQIGRARMLYDSSSEYSIGAISMLRETPSLKINTELDLVDPYDGRISLREALAYAAAGTRAFDGSYTVDFVNLFSGTVIMLDSTLGALTVKEGSFTADDPLIINGNGEVTITGSGLTQLFVIGRNNEVLMNVFTLSDGFAEDGGAVYNAGSLTMNRVTFSSNTAANNGGAVYNAGTLTITNSTFSNNSAGIDGGAVYNAGTLTMENIDSNGNMARQNGGVIYNAATGSLTVNDAIFQQNLAAKGGVIYNAGTLAAANATFFENRAPGNGGAIYNTGTLTAAGSTFFGNETTTGGGAIYSTGRLNLVNSILVGNRGFNDLYSYGQTDSYYSFIGTMQGFFTKSVGNHLDITPEELFGDQPVISSTKINGVTQRYFELADGASAVTAGTKLRVDGGILQYYDRIMSNWESIGTIALTTAQLQRDQIGRSRLNHDSSADYSAGAISMLKELPSLTVTTDQDVVNPYDGVISLREALAHAAAGTKAADDTCTITFADSLAGSAIEIDGKLGSLTVAAGAFIQENPLTIDGGGKISIDGSRSNTRVCLLEIAAGNYVSLNGLTFEGGGNAKGIGGAIINAGDLSVTNTTFSGNGISGQRGGGAIYNTGNLVIDNAAFIGNQSSEGGGGAIYNTGTLVISNATFSRNLADTNRGNSGGGAIWNSNGQVVVANSTFTGNQTHGKGGAIYAENGTLVVLNSTITQNSGRKDGSGIYCDSAELAIANSIILGNTDSANIKVTGNNGFSAVYLVTSEAPDKTPNYSDHNFFDCKDDPFTSGEPQKRTVNGVEQLYFEVKDVSAVKTAKDGTKLQPFYGKNGCDIEYYSKDSSNWQTLINYLKSVPTEDQLSHDQIGRDRLIRDRWLTYSIGAVNVVREDPSLIVTTDRDVVDPCDGLISLREAALYYAQSGDTITFDGKIDAVLDRNLELPFELTLDFGSGSSVSGGKDGIVLKSDFALTVLGSAVFNNLQFSGSGDLAFTGSTGGSATVDRTGGSVIYRAADAQTVYGGSYFDLSLSGTGSDGAEVKEFGGDITVANAFRATGVENEKYLQIFGMDHLLTVARTQDAEIRYTDLHNLTATERLSLDDTNTISGTRNIAVYLNTCFSSGKIIDYGTLPKDIERFRIEAYARGVLIRDFWLFLDSPDRPQVKDSEVTCYGIKTQEMDYYASATLKVTPKVVTVDGIGADDKIYDGTTDVTLNYDSVHLNGVVDGDTLGVSTSGYFSDKNAGNGKTVTLGALTLTGVDAGNYILAADGQQTETNASITPKQITVSGIGADDKIYDGTTDATLNYDSVHLNGIVDGDTLGVSSSGYFSDKNTGAGKTVTLGALTLIGADAGNYILAADGQQTETNASITPKQITVSGIGADDKIYDGTTDVTLNYDQVYLDGKVDGDALGVSTSGYFSDKNAGNGKTVTLGALTLTGADAGNYVLAASGQQTETTASITPKQITVSGIGADDKIYDGTADATLNYDQVYLDGKVDGDTLGVSASGYFGDKNAGAGKTVTLGTLALTGADAGNYTLAADGQQTETTASITPKAITVTADEQTKVEGTHDPDLTYQLTSGSLVSGDEFTGSPVRDAGEMPGTYVIHQGGLKVDDGNGGGNYTVAFVESILTITAGGRGLNYYQFSEGLNPNYSPTVPAIDGSWLAQERNASVFAVNPYAMDYPDLLAMKQFRQSPPTSSHVMLTLEDDRFMTSDHIDVTGDRLSGLKHSTAVSIDGGDGFDLFSIQHEPGRLFRSFPNVPTDDLLPADQDLSAIRALPEKSRAFKNEFELLLDDLVTA